MSSPWLSESEVGNATTAILLGPVEEEYILAETERFSSGVLLISPNYKPLNHKLIHYLEAGESRQMIRDKLTEFLSLDYHNPPVVKVSKATADCENFDYAALLTTIIQEIDTTLRARRSRNETGFLRQIQVFHNFSDYLRERVPDDWKSLGEHSLAIVVGAGPSLDATLPLLNASFPKPIIIATDSSLKALVNQGITPHFVVNIDPEKSFQSCSFPDYSPGYAILSSQSHGSWSDQWKRKKAFLSGRVVSEDWLAEKGISKTSVLSINNVGLTALNFANFLCPAAIMLVGMDLAGSGSGEHRYAKNTGRTHITLHAETYHQIPGNFEKSVPTPFFSDWRETSEACAKISQERLVINLNDRGAQLDGTTLIHPNGFEELRGALEENLKPFDEMNLSDLKRKEISIAGLTQILTLLATKCDQIWSKIPPDESSASENLLKMLTDVFADRDTASLLGDFAFSTMPQIVQGSKLSREELEDIVLRLKRLTWKLEDAILKTDSTEEFARRFILERFA